MQAFLFRTLPALLLAFGFGQAGEFAQQYRQRLGGAADALRVVVERFDLGASASGLTRAQAVERLEANPDALVARQGTDAAETVREFEAVERRYGALNAATPLTRPFAVLADPDWPTISRTAGDFAPALPVGAGGLLLTFVGFVAGWTGGSVCEGAARLVRRRRLRHAAAVLRPSFDHRPPIL